MGDITAQPAADVQSSHVGIARWVNLSSESIRGGANPFPQEIWHVVREDCVYCPINRASAFSSLAADQRRAP